MMKDYIPVVDFSVFGLDKTEVPGECLQDLAKEVNDAFSNVGFLYLKNHGISQDIINAAEKVSNQFFALTNQEKEKYRRDEESMHGYDFIGKETLNPERPGDYKESFDITPSNAKFWPNEEIPNFETALKTFFQECDALTQRLMEIITIGLNLPRTFFRECHNTHWKSNHTTLRLLHYPAIHDDSVIQAGQIRCGEHSDYGTITLLFQDDAGGLEVFSRDGQYVPATPIEGTIVVNIADLMQRWTTDKLISTKHRVVISDEDVKRKKPRMSMAYFVHPDDDFVVTCLDGSAKYPPISTLDYLNKRFSETYL